MMRFIFYTRPLQHWDRLPFYLMHRNQHRVLNKMNKHRTVFQMKHDNLNETEVRLQSDGHKDVL